MANIPTPAVATVNKTNSGISDVTSVNNVLKFLGCSIVSVNMSVGFNGTPSSLSVELVEDTENGDFFQEPTPPRLVAFSLPKGGVDSPIFVDNNFNFSPVDYFASNVPFYFCGIITSWEKDRRDVNGKTIRVTIADPREVLSGVQCLLSGFALSQSLGTGAPRYQNVKNVIDIFGYFDYGMTSGANEFGMEFFKIRQALEGVRVTLFDINFEFRFTGQTFFPPTFYRIDGETIDLIGLVSRVAADAGSDFLVVARKTGTSTCVVEFRGIKRTNNNPLTKSEVNNFLNARDGIVNQAVVGKEFRNEATSAIVVGGRRNSNYVALPTTHVQSWHTTEEDGIEKEDYQKWPHSVRTRLFGDQGFIINENGQAISVSPKSQVEDFAVGSVFPYWGMSPDNFYPYAEPFLPLDHLVVDRESKVKQHIPLCRLTNVNKQVRTRDHGEVFLSSEGGSDTRPFCQLAEYKFSDIELNGWTRGLPLNTEILRGALYNDFTFFAMYWLYYPDIADHMGMPVIDFESLKLIKDNGGVLKDVDIIPYVSTDTHVRDELLELRTVIYALVREYAERIGRSWIVCLPKSQIMERIFNGQQVPTREERPEIEYVVDGQGYWEDIPPEFDGFKGGIFSNDQENQIIQKFQSEDGRFFPMVIMKWKPTGNGSFNSNGRNKVLLQDLPTSEFRPNRIAEGTTDYVCISCSVNQLIKRPDLAIVEIPQPLEFDPTDGFELATYFKPNADGVFTEELDDEWLPSKGGIIRLLWAIWTKNSLWKDRAGNEFRVKDVIGVDSEEASEIFNTWADKIVASFGTDLKINLNRERVLDPHRIIIPLTSTWTTYGPYYYTDADAKGMVKIEVDDSLVPWNFARPPSNQPWYTNLDEAGQERLLMSRAVTEYIDTAKITVAGFPEYGPASRLGFNSNLTGISVSFGIGGVTTTYDLRTYSARPGTYRKTEYDNLSRSRISDRPQLPDVINFSASYQTDPEVFGTNRFPTSWTI